MRKFSNTLLLSLLNICLLAITLEIIFSYRLETSVVAPPSSNLNESNKKTYAINKISKQILKSITSQNITVQTKPTNKKYAIVLLKEKIDLMTGHYNDLFFASKRIAELKKWENELDWTSLLSRYKDHVANYIKYLSDISATQDEYDDLQKTLEFHKFTLMQLASKHKKNSSSNAPIDKVFVEINEMIPKERLTYIDRVVFDTSSVLNDSAFGEYITKNREHTWNQYTIKILPSKTATTEINVSPSATSSAILWTTNSNSEYYFYKGLLHMENLTQGNYAFKIDYQFNSNVNLIFDNVNSLSKRGIFSQDLSPHSFSYPNILNVTLEDNLSDNYVIYLNSNKQIDQRDLNKLMLTAYPILPDKLLISRYRLLNQYKPKFIQNYISKGESQITFINYPQLTINSILSTTKFGWIVAEYRQNINVTTVKLTNLTYRFFQGLAIILFTIQIAIFFNLKKFLNRLKIKATLLSKFISEIVNIQVNFLRKERACLMRIFIFFLLIDAITSNYFQQYVNILLVFFWVLITKLFKFEGLKSLHAAVYLLFVSSIFLIIHSTNIAEALGNWVYLLLLVGTIQLILKVRKNQLINKSN